MPTSRFDKTFARVGATRLAEWFGGGKGSATYVALDGAETTLNHMVLSTERREWRRRGSDSYGTELHLVREGWVMIDPNNPKYSGIQTIEIGAGIEVEGLHYVVEQATRGQRICDFRISRLSEMEISSPDFRSR